MALVVDASVGLKWVLREPDSSIAQALAQSDERLLMPDFWLGEAANVCWVQVRRGVWGAAQAREALDLLRGLVPVTPTGALGLHDLALDIALAVNHSVYDTLYVAFAIAMGARGVVVADGPFLAAMRRHADPEIAGLLVSLDEWGRA